MSKLGNVTNNYGQRYNYAVTNMNGESVMHSDDLIENTIIIASPSDAAKVDIGTYTMFVTDGNGTPVRLTYTIQPGKGLVIGRNGVPETSGDGIDVVSMAIDEYSIKTNPSTEALYVQAYNIIDNYTLTTHPYGLVGDYMSVVTANLDKATNETWGVVRSSDPSTAVHIDAGEVSIITEKLQYVDDDLNLNGIVRCQSDAVADLSLRTVEAQNGRLHVITKNLDKASYGNLGVIQPDEITTTTDANGYLSVIDFTKSYSYIISDSNITYFAYGIVRPDNVTVRTDIPGVFTVTTDGLQHADNNTFGIVRLDDESMQINSYGNLTVNRYSEIAAVLRDFDIFRTATKAKIHECENRIAALEAAASAEHIYSFVCVGAMMTTMPEPFLNTESSVANGITLYTKTNDGTNDTYVAVGESDIQYIDNTTTYYKASGASGTDYVEAVQGTDYTIGGTVADIEQEFSVVFSISTNCKFTVAVEFEDNPNPAVTIQSVKYKSDINVDGAGLTHFSFDSTNGNEETLKFSFRVRNYTADTPELTTATQVTFIVSSINTSSVYKKGVHTFIRYNTTSFDFGEYIATTRPAPVYTKDPDPSVLKHINNIVLNEDSKTDLSSVVFYGGRGSSDVLFNAIGQYEQREYVDTNDTVGTIKTYDSTIRDIVLDNNNSAPNALTVDIEYFKPTYYIPAVPIAKFEDFANDNENDFKRSYTSYGMILPQPKALSELTISDELHTCDAAISDMINGKNPNPTFTLSPQISQNGVSIQPVSNTLGFTTVKDWKEDSYANWLNVSILSSYGVTGTYNVLRLQSTYGIIDDRCAKVTIKASQAVSTQGNGQEPQKGNETNQTEFSVFYTEQYAETQPVVNVTANLENNSFDKPLTFTVTRSGHSRIVGPADEYNNQADKQWGVYVTFNYVAQLGQGSRTDGGAAMLATTPGTATTPHGINAPSTTIHITGNGSEHILTYTYDMGDMYRSVGTQSLSTIRITDVASNSFTYYAGPAISYNVSGIWVPRTSISNTGTFGDASISTISIAKWDDIEMVIQFRILPGAHTTIPAGADIHELISCENGDRSFKFIRGSHTYDWSWFYTYCQYKATPWSSTGCTVTYRFYNEVSNTQSPQTPHSAAAYRYVEPDGLSAESNADPFTRLTASTNANINSQIYMSQDFSHVTELVTARNLLTVPGAILPTINYIKFWFGLRAEWNFGSTTGEFHASAINFSTSRNGLSDRYGSASGISNNVGTVIQNVNITNAMYYQLSSSNVENIISNNTTYTNSISLQSLADDLSRMSTYVGSLYASNATPMGNLFK